MLIKGSSRDIYDNDNKRPYDLIETLETKENSKKELETILGK
jgi:hypothetical protein